MEKDIIVGIHSIVHAVNNVNREIYELIATEEGVENLKKMGGLSHEKISELPIKLLSSHKLQEEAKKHYDNYGYHYNRVPSGVMLLTSPVEIETPAWINSEVESGRFLKILCLPNKP